MDSFSIADLRDRLPLLDEKIAAAQRALDAAKMERAGAEAFIDMLEASEAAPRQPPVFRRRPIKGRGGNSPAVLAALQTDPEGVPLADIPRIVTEHGGPELDGEQVRSSIKYLRGSGLVERVGRGVWRAKMDIPRNTDGPAEAGPSDETSHRRPPEAKAG